MFGFLLNLLLDAHCFYYLQITGYTISQFLIVGINVWVALENDKVASTMTKFHLVFLISAITASLDTFIENHFSDNPICLVFSEEISISLLFTQSKIWFNVSKPLNEFNSKFLQQRVNYLVIAKDIENLIAVVREMILNQNYNPKQKHLILVQKHLNLAELKRCFELLLWQYDIYNVVITTNNSTRFKTWHPYGEKSSCGNSVVIESDSKTPFSNKMPSRFTKCKVKVMWKQYPVLTTSSKNESLGVINQMLLTIGEKIGLTMHFQQEENQLVYEEFINRTPTTRLAQYTTENRIDIVANKYGPSIAMYLDLPLELSFPFTVQEDLWLLPSKQPLPSVEAFLSALTFGQYLLISITFLSFMFIWRFASNNFFDVIRIFLQQPVYGIKNDTKKVLLICGLFFTIHMGAFYSSQLIRVLYRPVYPPSYKTLEEVLDKTDLKFSYPNYAGGILENKNVELWKRVEARTEEVLMSKIYTDMERKRRFLYLDGVFEIGSYDLYYVYNPEDLEILEEQVSLFI